MKSLISYIVFFLLGATINLNIFPCISSNKIYDDIINDQIVPNSGDKKTILEDIQNIDISYQLLQLKFVGHNRNNPVVSKKENIFLFRMNTNSKYIRKSRLPYYNNVHKYGFIKCMNKKYRLSLKHKYVFLNRKITFFPTIRKAIKYYISNNKKKETLLKLINLFDVPPSIVENHGFYSVLTLDNSYTNDILRTYNVNFEQLLFDQQYNKHVSCQAEFSPTSFSSYLTEAAGVIMQNLASNINFLLKPSKKYPAFESQYIYKYGAQDIDHYALNYINVVSTTSSNNLINKDVLVKKNATATAINVVELVETATNNMQKNKGLNKKNKMRETEIIAHKHLTTNHMQETYSQGCSYESDTFSNCIKQHQNIKSCESYRSKLTTCQHIALREVRFQSTYAKTKTGTETAASRQSARLEKVATKMKYAFPITTASSAAAVFSMGALLPSAPADGGSERDESAPMGPDNSNKAEYIIRHISELILTSSFDEQQKEGMDKIQQMVPPMMHASDVKGSCGMDIMEGIPFGPFNGFMPMFKQVGMSNSTDTKKVDETESNKFHFREKMDQNPAGDPPPPELPPPPPPPPGGNSSNSSGKIPGPQPKRPKLEDLLDAAKGGLPKLLECAKQAAICLKNAANMAVKVRKLYKRAKKEKMKAGKKMEEGTLDKKDAMKAQKKGNHFKKKAKRIGKLAKEAKIACFAAKDKCLGKSPKHPPKAPSLPNVDGDQTNLPSGGNAVGENSGSTNGGNLPTPSNNGHNHEEVPTVEESSGLNGNPTDDSSNDEDPYPSGASGGESSDKPSASGKEGGNKANDGSGGESDDTKSSTTDGIESDDKSSASGASNGDSSEKTETESRSEPGPESDHGNESSGKSEAESGNESGNDGTSSTGTSNDDRSDAENEKKRDEEFHKATVLSEAYKKKQEADRIAYEEKKKKSAKEVVATQKAKEATKYYEKLKKQEQDAKAGLRAVNDEVIDGDSDAENKTNPMPKRCDEECKKKQAEEQHKQKIKNLKIQEQGRKNSENKTVQPLSFLSLSKDDGDDNEPKKPKKGKEKEEEDEEKQKQKEEEAEEVLGDMKADGLPSLPDPDDKDLKVEEDKAAKDVEDKIATFEKAKEDVDKKNVALLNANLKLKETQVQAERMKKKTAAAVEKARIMTLKLNNATDKDPETRKVLRMKAETASEASGTQIRLSATFADAVALMAKKAKEASVALADATFKKKQAKDELIAAEKKKEVEEEFDSESSKALGVENEDDEDDDDKDDADDDEGDDKDEDIDKMDEKNISDEDAYGWLRDDNWIKENQDENSKKTKLNLTHINLNLAKLKTLHCKSAYNLVFVTDNEMSDIFEFLQRTDTLKMEQAMQKMSQAIKYIVLTVFEYRSCSHYMKQMKIENDFEFYDLLQHVKPRSQRPIWARKYTKPKVNKLFLQSNRTLQRILFIESEAKQLENMRDQMAKKYKCVLPGGDQVDDQKTYKKLEENLIPREISKGIVNKALPGKNSDNSKNLLNRNTDSYSKNIFQKPKILKFDPQYDQKIPYNLQHKTEKVIDDIEKAEKLAADNVIQSASRSMLVPLLNMKQYLRNNISVQMEREQRLNSDGTLRKLPLDNNGGKENDDKKSTDSSLKYVSKEVKPRKNVPGIRIVDAEEDPRDKLKIRSSEYKPETSKTSEDESASLLEIHNEADSRHGEPVQQPFSQDLFDAHAISDRLGNAGIISSTGQAHIVLSKPGVSCAVTCLKETDNLQVSYPTKLQCNAKETRRLNNCNEMTNSVLCRKGCRYIDETKYPGVVASTFYYFYRNRDGKLIRTSAGKGTCLIYKGSASAISCDGQHRNVQRICACGFDRKNPAMVPPKKAKDAKKSNVVNRGGQPPAKSSIIAPSKARAKRSKNVKQNTVNKQKAKAVNKKVHSKKNIQNVIHKQAGKDSNMHYLHDNIASQCPDYLIRLDAKVKQITHSQHELSLAMQERAVFLRKKANYLLDRARSVEEIYLKTKGNNKGLYSKELNAADMALKFDQDAAKKARSRQAEAEKALQTIGKKVQEIHKEREEMLIASNPLVSFIQIKTEEKITQRMNSLLQMQSKEKAVREGKKSDPVRIESDEIRDFQNPDAGIKSGKGGNGGVGLPSGGKCQKGYFARVITQELIHTLTTFFVGAFSRHIPEAVTGPTVDAVSAQIQDQLATGTAERLEKTLSDAQRDLLSFTVPTAIEAVATRPCAVMAVYTIAHLLTRGLTHTLTPTLVHSLAYGDHEETYCYNCHTYGEQCNLCFHSDESTYYASHYSDYYQSYYSDYYADFYIEKFIRDLPPLPQPPGLPKEDGTEVGEEEPPPKPGGGKEECKAYLSEHQGGKFYDCNDNGRARDAGNDQGCIDNVLGKPDPFGDGRKVKVVKNWGADGHCQ